MTALALAPPEADAAVRPVPWRRLAWVTWRRYRLALVSTAGLAGPARGEPDHLG